MAPARRCFLLDPCDGLCDYPDVHAGITRYGAVLRRAQGLAFQGLAYRSLEVAGGVILV